MHLSPARQDLCAESAKNVDYAPAVGNDDLVHLLCGLAAAADGGHITYLNQLAHITLDCDEQTATQIEALANRAGVGITVQRV